MVNALYVWVEGIDDRRFFERVVRPELERVYERVEIVEYARRSPKWRASFVKSISAMGADYLYVSDLDSAPCITARKNDLCRSLACLDKSKVVIVIPEIEGWYLAGLSDEACDTMGIKRMRHAGSVTKEQLDAMRPKSSDSRINFMLEILNHYSLDVAKTKSTSLAYFARRSGI